MSQPADPCYVVPVGTSRMGIPDVTILHAPGTGNYEYIPALWLGRHVSDASAHPCAGVRSTVVYRWLGPGAPNSHWRQGKGMLDDSADVGGYCSAKVHNRNCLDADFLLFLGFGATVYYRRQWCGFSTDQRQNTTPKLCPATGGFAPLSN